jgi:rod shape-determining protein MreD
MAYLLGSLVMVLLAVVQSSLLNRFPFLHGTVNLILVATVSWALTGRVAEAMVWGFCGGLVLDLLSGAPFGVSSVALVVTTYLASLTEGRFWEGHPLAPLGVMAVASLVYFGLTASAVWLSGHPIDPAFALTQVVLPSTLLNVLLALPAAQLAGRLRETWFPPQVGLG